jgi:hypothetical protein
VKRLIAIIHPENVPSQRVAEKIGLAYERDAISGLGRARTHLRHSVVKSHRQSQRICEPRTRTAPTKADECSRLAAEARDPTNQEVISKRGTDCPRRPA